MNYFHCKFTFHCEIICMNYTVSNDITSMPDITVRHFVLRVTYLDWSPKDHLLRIALI